MRRRLLSVATVAWAGPTMSAPPPRVLIVVDIQNDFMPGGALAVPDGDATIAVANAVMPGFDVVVATQDWHPAGHHSFAAFHPGRQIGEVIEVGGVPQVLWPVHCVEGSRGAELRGGAGRRAVHAGF
jgi:nicotinamidase/pyrazinamidase